MNALILPTAGQRIGAVYGPGEHPQDNAGTVMSLYSDRWGTHALVMMDDGKIKRCEQLNRGPGIGWHAL